MHRLSLAVFKDNLPDHKLSGLPTQFMTDILSLIPPLTSRGPWLVGGTVRRVLNNQLPDTDFDIMFKDPAQFDNFCGEMRERGAETKYESPQQITFDLNGTEIQAIRAIYHNTLIQTLNDFDFTLCQFGFDGTDFVWGDTSAEDVRANKLVFTHTTDPIATMRRMFKYANQGFYMDSAEIGRFLKAMTKQEPAIDAAQKKWSGDVHVALGDVPSYHSGGLVTPPFPPAKEISYGKASLGGIPVSLSPSEVFVSLKDYTKLKEMTLDYTHTEQRIMGNHTVDIFPLFKSTRVIVNDSI